MIGWDITLGYCDIKVSITIGNITDIVDGQVLRKNFNGSGYIGDFHNMQRRNTAQLVVSRYYVDRFRIGASQITDILRIQVADQAWIGWSRDIDKVKSAIESGHTGMLTCDLDV